MRYVKIKNNFILIYYVVNFYVGYNLFSLHICGHYFSLFEDIKNLYAIHIIVPELQNFHLYYGTISNYTYIIRCHVETWVTKRD